ncbi:hypothetical protein WR25_00777 [Diploscapter pachys]|uniref:Uncharacterized protein n=1 Tax=Diploscapter pachys TaxID=2018661 RepID=A0A2A2KI53_9BILA|nr:hypothetical protein WR25_00777 [Diploscapter pachys]
MLKFLVLASFVCLSLQQQNVDVVPNVVVVPNPPSSGITCTRRASAQIIVDGVPSQVFCSIGPNSRDGCMGCCKAVGLSRGLTTINIDGKVSKLQCARGKYKLSVSCNDCFQFVVICLFVQNFGQKNVGTEATGEPNGNANATNGSAKPRYACDAYICTHDFTINVFVDGVEESKRCIDAHEELHSCQKCCVHSKDLPENIDYHEIESFILQEGTIRKCTCCFANECNKDREEHMHNNL